MMFKAQLPEPCEIATAPIRQSERVIRDNDCNIRVEPPNRLQQPFEHIEAIHARYRDRRIGE